MPQLTPRPPSAPPPALIGRTVLAWTAPPVALARRPRPNLAAHSLSIDGPMPLPGEYPARTAGFRYWATAEALGRAAGLWRAALGGDLDWAGAGVLRVHLGGTLERAAYARAGLRLPVAAPALAARAIGVAVLDALRPELWDIAAAEADAIHHAFAEATAQMIAGVRAATDGFPAVFAGLLAALAPAHGPGAHDAAARLMLSAAWRAAVAPDLMAQFAAELAVAAAVQEGPALAVLLRDLLAAHGLLARSPVLDRFDPHEAEDGTEIPLARHPLPWVAVAAPGLALPLLLRPASQPPRLLAAPETAPAPLAEAWRHARGLLDSGMAEAPRVGRGQRSAPGTNRWASHLLVDDGRTLRLVRQRVVI